MLPFEFVGWQRKQVSSASVNDTSQANGKSGTPLHLLHAGSNCMAQGPDHTRQANPPRGTNEQAIPRPSSGDGMVVLVGGKCSPPSISYVSQDFTGPVTQVALHAQNILNRTINTI